MEHPSAWGSGESFASECLTEPAESGVQLRENLSGARGGVSRDSRHKLGSREEQTFFNQAPAFKYHNSENCFKRKETERFRAFTYHKLMQREKVNFEIFWLKDEDLEDS